MGISSGSTGYKSGYLLNIPKVRYWNYSCNIAVLKYILWIKRNMNSFWNTYHSYYRPLLESVKESCNAAFQVYSTAKECYSVCSDCKR